ncbi:hypothetical protein [Rhizohabitans arisaemae]|uniref:hypothetical protein n=1 Tax=Rhizohabitans arisaemae TaxID=2720610 RepID=UPI0024B0FF88|nr:hypothetical protein [Rhizohabitans arisaemae]
MTRRAVSPASLSAIDAASERVMREGMTDRHNPVYLSVLRADARSFVRRHPEVVADRADARVLRSVLMKPESETHLGPLHARVERLAAGGN